MSSLFLHPVRDSEHSGESLINPEAIGDGPDLWLQATGPLGTSGARVFDGAGQYVELDTAIDPLTSDFWVSVLVKTASTSTQRILWTGGAATNQDGFSVGMAAGDITVQLCDSVSGVIAAQQFDTQISDDAWHHIAVCFDRDGNATVYIDGVAEATTLDISSHQATLGSTGASTIGIYRPSLIQSFNGSLSKIQYGTGLLTTAEITQLYNSGAGLVTAELPGAILAKTVHSWNCNEAPGETLYDSVGANDGTPSLPTTNLVSNGDFADGDHATELLTDGGFESDTGGVFDEWTGTSVGTGSVSPDTATKHGDLQSCKVTTGDNAWIYVYQSDVNVVADETYYLVFWTRGDGDYDGRYRVFDQSNVAYIQDITSTGATGTDWTRVSLEFTAPAGCALVRIQLYGNATATAQVWFDDVSVTKVSNVDFDDWTESTAGTSTINSDSGGVTGDCCRFDVDASNNNVYMTQAALTSGHTYTVSLQARASATANSGVSVRVGGGDIQYDDATTGWQSFTFADLTASSTEFMVRRGNNLTSKSIYLDDISVVRTGPHVSSGAGPAGADYSTGVSDGDPVTSWTDRANGIVFSQATVASRPIYRAAPNGIGSHYPAIEFDGEDDYLKHAVGLWATATEGLIVAVVEPDGVSAGIYLSSSDEATGNYYFSNRLADELAVLQRSNDTASSIGTAAATISATAVIVGVESSGTAYKLYIDGADKSLTIISGANTGDWFGDTANRDNVVVGATVRSTLTTFFNGKISEILVYNTAVSAADRTALFQRLAAQYGIALA